MAALANQTLNSEGFFLVAIGIGAYLDEVCNQYKLPHFNSNQPCCWCPTDVNELPWTDLGAESACFALTYAASNAAHRARPNDHPIWSTAGLNRFSVLWDIMHGSDMGPTMHFNGNVLYDLTSNTNLGANRISRLQWVFVRKRQA